LIGGGASQAQQGAPLDQTRLVLTLNLRVWPALHRKRSDVFGQGDLLGDRRGEGADLWNMSLAMNGLGQHQKAIELAEAALKVFEEIEDPRAVKVRSALEEWKRQV